MPFFTPLRYPGGKRRLVPAVTRVLEANKLRDIAYAEPYAGGAAIGLELLFSEYADQIHINDLARPVYAFWHSVLYETAELCDLVERVPVTIDEWHRQRATYESQADASLLELGFAAFFLNRTNRSGILGGGVIGGQAQSGKWRLDVRFRKQPLIGRIKRIGRYRSRIHLTQLDALDFTKDVVASLSNGFAFYDPPYIGRGTGLYLNDYTLEGHREVAKLVTGLRVPWLVTYDEAAATEGLYAGHRQIEYGLHYTAQARGRAKEVMFLSDSLRLPREWAGERFKLVPERSRYPFFGRLVESSPRAVV